MKFLMYGAGSIGRGFIGALFAQNGYEVVFVDVDTELVKQLNAQKRYPLEIMADKPYTQYIENIRAIDGNNRAEVVAEIVQCDLMAVSVGARVLKPISPIIAEGLLSRKKQTNKELNVLICENLKNSSGKLRGWLEEVLAEQGEEVLKNTGLVEVAIGRMVPAREKDENNSLLVRAESYGFLPLDSESFLGDLPEIAEIVPYAPFAFFEERKLYIHNMAHAICAYLGIREGYTYMWEAMDDCHIVSVVENAMLESALTLSQKYDYPMQPLYNHTLDLLRRFANRALGDTCERVARDTLRKIDFDDRIVGALRNGFSFNVFPVNICLGLGAALLTLTADVNKAVEIQTETCRLKEKELKVVTKLFENLRAEDSLAANISFLRRLADENRGSVI